MDKQPTGFKFGKYPLSVLQALGEIRHNGRTYRLVEVLTFTGERYIALRLYNSQGKFIKQFLMETEVYGKIARLMLAAQELLSASGDKDHA